MPNKDEEYDKIIDMIEDKKEEKFIVDVKEEKEESWIKKMWNKTIFPDMIKNKKEANKRKREEAEKIKQIRHEARKQALEEIQPQIVEEIKKQELDKLTGKKKQDWMEKLSKGFEMKGDGALGGGMDKVVNMMGVGTGGVGGTDKINMMLGQPAQRQEPDYYYEEVPRKRKTKKKKKKVVRRVPQPQQQPMDNFEDKMRRIIG